MTFIDLNSIFMTDRSLLMQFFWKTGIGQGLSNFGRKLSDF